MKGYFIKATNVTPSIYFNPASKLLDIRGRSVCENPLVFYNYIIDSIEKYNDLNVSELSVNFAFEYFNTSSSKCLYMVLKKINMLHSNGKSIVINWYFELDDEDMCEAGDDLSSLFNFDFRMIEIPEIKVLGASTSKEKAVLA